MWTYKRKIFFRGPVVLYKVLYTGDYGPNTGKYLAKLPMPIRILDPRTNTVLKYLLARWTHFKYVSDGVSKTPILLLSQLNPNGHGIL